MPEQQLQQRTDSSGDREFNEECLRAHNDYRELHGCLGLKFSAKLAARAQAWAEHLAGIGYLKHSPNAAGNFGENVAMKMALGSRDYKGSQATAQWYSEIEMYDFTGVENQSRCGHFSQVVWMGTKKAGFGKAVSADGKMFAVGQYTPPGNMMNCWVANVPPPVSGQIKVPTHEDIMGADQERAAAKIISSSRSLVDESNPAGQLLLTASQEFGDFARLEPRPKDPQDKQIGKATKTRIINGEKSLVLTLTFMRPDGTRYQLSNQVALQDDNTAPRLPASNGSNGTMSVHSNGSKLGVHSNGTFDDDFSQAVFSSEMLMAHNEMRARHGSPRLLRSESLERLAQAWSDSLTAEGQLRHCDLAEAEGLGQSVARLPGHARLRVRLPADLGQAALLAKQWYQERVGFQLGTGDQEDGCCINGGHFTQMVWRSTEKLGVGCTLDNVSGDVYAVCFYRPSGNIAGQFADNVLPAN